MKAPDDHTECRHGGHFHCESCGSECNRDVVGVINVGRKYLSDSTMEKAKPVAYIEAGNHASFPSPAVEGARSSGVQSTAEQQQDSASGCQTRLARHCATGKRGESEMEMGGLHQNQNQSSNTGRQLPSGSITR